MKFETFAAPCHPIRDGISSYSLLSRGNPQEFFPHSTSSVFHIQLQACITYVNEVEINMQVALNFSTVAPALCHTQHRCYA